MVPCKASALALALLALSGSAEAQKGTGPLSGLSRAAPAPARLTAAELAKREAAWRATFAKLYSDLVVSKARWDGAWALGTTQTAKTALDNLAACSRDFMGLTQQAAVIGPRLAELPPEALSDADRKGILDGLRSLERIARAHDDADYEYRSAPTGVGPKVASIRAAWHVQRDRLSAGMVQMRDLFRRPAWAGKAFDDAVSPVAWCVPLLERFNAIPDLDLHEAANIGVAFRDSLLGPSDRITGIRRAGEAAFAPIDGWASLKAYLRANADGTGPFELRAAKGDVERTVAEPAKK